MTLLARIISGTEKRSNGDVRRLREWMIPWVDEEVRNRPKGPYDRNTGDVISNYLTGGLHPGLGAVYRFVQGTSFEGDKRNPFLGMVLDSLPLAASQAVKTFKSEGVEESVVLSLMYLFGEGLQPNRDAIPILRAFNETEDFDKRVSTVARRGIAPSASSFDTARALRYLDGLTLDERERLREAEGGRMLRSIADRARKRRIYDRMSDARKAREEEPPAVTPEMERIIYELYRDEGWERTIRDFNAHWGKGGNSILTPKANANRVQIRRIFREAEAARAAENATE